jgi:hypothetical protein
LARAFIGRIKAKRAGRIGKIKVVGVGRED